MSLLRMIKEQLNRIEASLGVSPKETGASERKEPTEETSG